ncbi:unnamed protein product [Umbelopsis vinacea]
MKFFLPSTVIVLVLALCAQSGPPEQDGCNACRSYQTCSNSNPKTCVDPWTPVGCYVQTQSGSPPSNLTIVKTNDGTANPGFIASGENGFDPLQCWSSCKHIATNANVTATSFGLQLEADPSATNSGETFCYCYTGNITSDAVTAAACDYTFGFDAMTNGNTMGNVMLYTF